jgi:hypothetical protein
MGPQNPAVLLNCNNVALPQKYILPGLYTLLLKPNTVVLCSYYTKTSTRVHQCILHVGANRSFPDIVALLNSRSLAHIVPFTTNLTHYSLIPYLLHSYYPIHNQPHSLFTKHPLTPLMTHSLHSYISLNQSYADQVDSYHYHAYAPLMPLSSGLGHDIDICAMPICSQHRVLCMPHSLLY